MYKAITWESLNAKIITSDFQHSHRETVMKGFLRNEFQILVTTNQLRSVDTAGVCLIINYEPPTSEGMVNTKTYLYRAGRTARYGAGGAILTFIQTEKTNDFLSRLKNDLLVTATKFM